MLEELAKRGAGQGWQDSKGRSLLHRALLKNQHHTALTLLTLQPDSIQRPDHDGLTPVHTMINKRCIDLFAAALKLCPDLVRVANRQGQTILHSACQAGREDMLSQLVVKGANALAVTRTRQSVLMCAVQSRDRAMALVARCLSLGVSTHQPAITGKRKVKQGQEASLRKVSPFAYAVYHDLHDLCHVLYHAGACSNSELFTLDAHNERLRAFSEGNSEQQTQSVVFLQTVASVPRTLTSLCRLRVSHLVRVEGDREKAVRSLPLTQRMQGLILFSDLVRPQTLSIPPLLGCRE